jgi:1,4-alpha-glucan branching enzyme
VLSKNETVSLGEIERLVAGQHHDPHSVLGAHPVPGDGPVVEGTVIRALRPLATSVTAVLPDGSRHPMTHRHLGVFEVTVPGEAGSVRDYRLEVSYVNGDPQLQDDPYRHLPTLGELDLYLIGEGRHEQLWDALGARPVESEGEQGTAFAVWAPNARGVRLVGDFNFWDGRAHPMRSLGGAGVWELFVPGVAPGSLRGDSPGHGVGRLPVVLRME